MNEMKWMNEWIIHSWRQKGQWTLGEFEYGTFNSLLNSDIYMKCWSVFSWISNKLQGGCDVFSDILSGDKGVQCPVAVLEIV